MELPCEEIHTLGPSGTNCATAADLWNSKSNLNKASVTLHATLETALEAVLSTDKNAVLLGCIVYPNLHKIVFENLDSLELTDLFIMPTHRMVFAAPSSEAIISTVATHPAPRSLVEGRGYTITEVSSNSQAALDCASGAYDACITTSVAAKQRGLITLEDAGHVAMGFSIHQKKGFC